LVELSCFNAGSTPLANLGTMRIARTLPNSTPACVAANAEISLSHVAARSPRTTRPGMEACRREEVVPDLLRRCPDRLKVNAVEDGRLGVGHARIGRLEIDPHGREPFAPQNINVAARGGIAAGQFAAGSADVA